MLVREHEGKKLVGRWKHR